MTQPAGTARVEIVADLSRFAREAQRDLDRALRGIRIDPVEVRGDFDRVEREARDAADDVGDRFQRGGEQAEDAIREIGDVGEREFDRVEREARDAGRGMRGALTGAAVAISTAFAAVAIGGFIRDAVLAADELSDAMAISEQVISQTGGAAGLLADEVRDISRSLSLEIGVDSAQVQNAANVLLTFQGVSEDVFGRSLSAAADLTTLFGTDLQGATLQLGKALQDPIRGINALSRSGVNFTAAQREQIAALVESNDLLGAQEIILANVEAQVGGAAAVAADSWAVVANTFREVQRALGEALIPALDAVAPALIGLAESLAPLFGSIGTVLGGLIEQVTPIIGVLGGALGEGLAALMPAIEPVGAAFTAIVEALAPLLPVVGRLIGTLLPPLAQIVEQIASGPLTVLAEAISDLLLDALLMLEPHLPLIVDLFGQFADVMAANMQEILPIVSELLLELLAAILPLTPDLIELAEAILPIVSNTDLIIPLLEAMSTLILLAVIPAVEQLAALLNGDLAGAFPAVAGPVLFLRDRIESAFSFITEFVGDSVGRLRAVLNGISSIVSRVVGFFGDLRSGVSDRINGLLGLIRGVPGRILSAIGNLGNLLRNAGRNVIEGLLNGIRSMIPDLSGLLGSITGSLPDWKGPPDRDRQLLRDSGRWVMQGFQQGISDERSNVRRLLEGVTDDVGVTPFSGRVAGGDGSSAAVPDEFVATAEINLGEGITQVVDIKFERRNRATRRRFGAGTGVVR